jgi:GNAT superfamily N-acetyltransferase
MKNESRFSIRQATIDDLESLVDLRLEFLREVNATNSDPSFRDNLYGYFSRTLPAGEFLAWLAEADGAIIGTSGLVFFERPPSFNNFTGQSAYIMNMYTLPAWRGRGVATALLNRVLDYIKTTPCRSVSLHATEQGRSLYERVGFLGTDEVMGLELR